jgi:hypothetical protein
MTRRLLAALFVTATAFVLVARADPGSDIKIPPVKAPGTVDRPKDEGDPKAREADLPRAGTLETAVR